MPKKPTKRERNLVEQWKVGIIPTQAKLAQKLKMTRVGTLGTIARVYKHEYEE